MNKKETELKQSLMQKDKEQLVELYLQMKWERDYLEEMIFTKKKDKTINFDLWAKQFERNKILEQQLKEKEQEIESLNTDFNQLRKNFDIAISYTKEQDNKLKDNTHQVCDKIKFLTRANGIFGQKSKDMDYNQFNDILKQVEEDKDNMLK